MHPGQLYACPSLIVKGRLILAIYLSIPTTTYRPTTGSRTLKDKIAGLYRLVFQYAPTLVRLGIMVRDCSWYQRTPGAGEVGALGTPKKVGVTQQTAHSWATSLWRVPDAPKRGAKSEVARKWPDWLHHPCHLRVPQCFRARANIRSGPQMGGWAMSPLPSKGCETLPSRGENRQWPTSGRNGHITPPIGRVPNAWERGSESVVAHKWADWLHHP